MPSEIEAKLRVDDHAAVRDRLSALGAQFVRVGVETNVILDRPDRSLLAAGMGLRVRLLRLERGEPAAPTLTVKGPMLPGALKVREELEVSVSDADATIALLMLLGFVPVIRYEKRREAWRLGACQVDLDEPAHLGLFVEIEGPGPAEIAAVQRALGLDHLSHEPRSYVALLAEFCKRTGRSPLTLTLP